MLVGSFEWRRQNTCCDTHAYRISQCHEAEERADCRQADVPRRRLVMPLLFEVLQEAQDRWSGQVFDRQSRPLLAGCLLEILQQQAERISITFDRAAANPLVITQVFGEEALKQRSNRRFGKFCRGYHCSSP